ncbi:MAG: hypothetical protein ACRD1T_22835, partial [Acidimicrobiia bacterium]
PLATSLPTPTRLDRLKEASARDDVSAMLGAGVGGAVAGLILGLACIGYCVFQIVAPHRDAQFNFRYNLWLYARIPWFYSLPRMKHRLDEDWLARASRRFYGPLFVAMGLVFAVRAIIAAISKM